MGNLAAGAAILSTLPGCSSSPEGPIQELRALVEEKVAGSGAEVSVFYVDLEGGDSLLISPDLRMHAASTMKVPVMMRLFLDQDEGILSIDDSLEVTTTFHSIVDGSPFVLPPESDSETALYERIGERVTYRHLIEEMITISSNLATNLLIQEAEPARVTALVRSLGADSMEVLRGVEDLPAFEAGLSNTTTARDLGILFLALARGEVGSPAASREMVEVLLRQKHNTMIPAGLPQGVPVAHKTGSITRIRHDGGIVYPQGAPPFVLVILTRGFESGEEADALGAAIAQDVFRVHLARHSGSHD